MHVHVHAYTHALTDADLPLAEHSSAPTILLSKEENWTVAKLSLPEHKIGIPSLLLTCLLVYSSECVRRDTKRLIIDRKKGN
jgi:hypothetical protein